MNVFNGIRYVTHNGLAHADEMYAIAAHLTTLERVDVTKIEIVRTNDLSSLPTSTKRTVIIDTGCRYDGVDYFDHHQEDREVCGECSFSLVVKSNPRLTDLYANCNDFRYLVDRITVQDTVGLHTFLNKTTTKRDVATSFAVAEYIFIHLFQSSPQGAVDAVRTIYQYFKSLLDQQQDIENVLSILKEIYIKGMSPENQELVRTSTVPFPHNIFASKMIKSFCGPRSTINLLNCLDAMASDSEYYEVIQNIPPRTFNLALNQFMNMLITPIMCTLTVGLNDTQAAGHIQFFRTPYGERDGLDFSKLNGPDIKFAHKGGFLVVLSKDISHEHMTDEYIESCMKRAM